MKLGKTSKCVALILTLILTISGVNYNSSGLRVWAKETTLEPIDSRGFSIIDDTGKLEIVELDEMISDADEKDAEPVARLMAQSTDDDDSFETARLLVNLNASEKSCGANMATEIMGDGYVVLQYDSPKAAEEAYEYYCNSDKVDAVEVDSKIFSIYDYNSWGYAAHSDNSYAINLDEFKIAYEASFSSEEIVVAVIDTGLSTRNSLFTGRLAEWSADFVNGDTMPYDDHGHGTHCAGTIVEATPSNVKIAPIKVLDEEGEAYASVVTQGIYYATEQGADVINMSLGAQGQLPTMDLAIEDAYEHNVIVCVAAGNDSINANDVTPASSPYTITVGAMTNTGELADFSNYGECLDVIAPGVNIVSASLNGDLVSMSGTSMATPHASAVCALFKCYDRSMIYDDALVYIQASALSNGYEEGYLEYSVGGVLQDVIPRLILGANTFATPSTPTAFELMGEGSLSCDLSTQLRVNFSPMGSSEPIEWSSDRTDLATVDSGRVLANSQGKTGTVTISARGTRSGITKSFSIEIDNYAYLLAPDVRSTWIELSPGENEQLVVRSLEYQNAPDETPVYNDRPIPQLTWVSDDPSIVEVNQNGRVTAKQLGHAEIRFYYKGLWETNWFFIVEVTQGLEVTKQIDEDNGRITISWPSTPGVVEYALYPTYYKKENGVYKAYNDEALNQTNGWIKLDQNTSYTFTNRLLSDDIVLTSFRVKGFTQYLCGSSNVAQENMSIWGQLASQEAGNADSGKVELYAMKVDYHLCGGENSINNSNSISLETFIMGSNISNKGLYNFYEGKYPLFSPTREPDADGYAFTFDGWYYDENYTKPVWSAEHSDEYALQNPGMVFCYLDQFADVSLYAKWKKIIPGYTVTYNPHGGTWADSTCDVVTYRVQEGASMPKYTEQKMPVSNGREFAGWQIGATWDKANITWDYSRAGQPVNYSEAVYTNYLLVPIWKEVQTGHEHSLETRVTKASTSEAGKREKVCLVCKKVIESETIYPASNITLSSASYAYNGKVKKPSVSVKDSQGNDISSSSYSISYDKGRKKVGKYYVTVTLKGDYSGSKKLSFVINPQKTAISSLKAISKGFTIKWNKRTTEVTGYEIQYSRSAAFKNNNKTLGVTSSKRASRTISKLKSKKKYYVRIRTYKTVGKEKYYSSWSVKKTVTTR